MTSDQRQARLCGSVSCWSRDVLGLPSTFAAHPVSVFDVRREGSHRAVELDRRPARFPETLEALSMTRSVAMRALTFLMTIAALVASIAMATFVPIAQVLCLIGA